MKSSDFVDSINALSVQTHAVNVAKGFWEKDKGTFEDDSAKLMLMVGELSEAHEAMRDGNPPSVKIPRFSHVEEELADCVIRIFDFCARRGFRLAEAILAKIEHNTGRPYMHGRVN